MKPTQQVTIRVPSGVWQLFRAHVILEGRTARDVIEEMMVNYVEERSNLNGRN